MEEIVEKQIDPKTAKELEKFSRAFQSLAGTRATSRRFGYLVGYSKRAVDAAKEGSTEAFEDALQRNDLNAVRRIHQRLLRLVEEGDQVVGAAIVGATHAAVNQSRRIASEAAKGRIERDRDGKQAAKINAHELWQNWQSGKNLHKSGAAFHRYVLEKCPTIVDTKTVARWCKAWREEARK